MLVISRIFHDFAKHVRNEKKVFFEIFFCE